MGFFMFALLFIVMVPHVVVPDREKRIVGGRNATVTEVPFIGSLRKPDGEHGDGTYHYCGGSLIRSDLLLTAAHCHVNASQDKVVFGYLSATDPKTTTSPGYQSENFQEVTSHENYDNVTDENDIALVQLRHPVELNTSYVSIIALSNSTNPREYYKDSSCYIAGWGDTGPSTDASTLQLARTKIVGGQECRDTYGDDVVFNDTTMICARWSSNDACSGDSGGPLYCQKNNRLELVGIVSWGTNSCMAGDPGVYTKVSSFTGWIADNSPPIPGSSNPMIPAMSLTSILVISWVLAFAGV